MAKVMKVLRVVRNNWKKSTFFTIVLGFGTNYGLNKYETFQMMRTYCEEAESYGNRSLPLGVNPRHVTVLLNPTANKGKSKDLFEKYCAPLLHLAGIRVSIVQTDSEGQARTYMDVMNNTDAVVVAGGDGTVSEVVTGLLRRQDEAKAASRFPVGVLPLGRSSAVAFGLFLDASGNRVKAMAEATMAVVRDVLKAVDVMRIETVEPEEGKPSRPVFALGRLQWGAFRDGHERQDKYWFYGSLRKYATYVFSAFKDLTWKCDADLRYTLPCDGCTKCYVPPSDGALQMTWMQWLVSAFIGSKSRGASQPTIDYSKVENPECSLWHEKQLSSVELSVTSANVSSQNTWEKPDHLKLQFGPKSVSFTQYISEGWRRESKRGEAQLIEEEVSVKQLELKPHKVFKEGESEIWFSIDNEDFEVKPVLITLMPKKILMYCRKED